MKLPFEIDGQQFQISASIGVAMCPYDGHDAAELMKSSDIAMYRAKERPGENIVFFSELLFKNL